MGESDHRWPLTQRRYCLGRVCDKRRKSLGQIPERSTQGSRSWVEGREKGPNIETNDRQREETNGGLLPMLAGHGALQSQPAGLRRRHSGEHTAYQS